MRLSSMCISRDKSNTVLFDQCFTRLFLFKFLLVKNDFICSVQCTVVYKTDSRQDLSLDCSLNKRKPNFRNFFLYIALKLMTKDYFVRHERT